MNIIEKFKQFPEFPQLSRDNLIAFKKNTAKDIKRLRLLGTHATPEENTALDQLKKEEALYESLIQYADLTLSIYKLLPEETMENLDQETIHALLDYWKKTFTDALQYEPVPLSLLSLLQDTVSTPIELSALILCLLDKGITAKQLIDSKLLHHYFMSKIHAVDISWVYDLLKGSKSSSVSQELSLLIYLSQRTTIVVPRIGVMKLTGEFYRPILNNDTPFTPQHHPFSFTVTKDNWNALCQGFGKPFLLKILPSHLLDDTEINSLFKELIRDMPCAEMIGLWHAAQTMVHEDHRRAVLKRLCECISDDQAESLLNDTQPFLWIILRTKPSLLKKLDAARLEHLIKNCPITLSNAYTALQCAQDSALEVHSELIHLAVLNCLMEQVTEIDDRLIFHFKLIRLFCGDARSFSWCSSKNKTLLDEFNILISNHIPLTADGYIIIMDYYRKTRPKWALLEKLSSNKHPYPRDSYDVQSHIIHTLFQANQLMELSCLDIFHPMDEYSAEDKRTAKIRTLLTCLATQDNASLQQWIIEQLNIRFDIRNWKQHPFGTTSLRDLAIEHENTALLTRYFQTWGSIGMFQFLQENKRSLFFKLLNYPKSLNVALSNLDKQAMFCLHQGRDQTGQTILHLVLPQHAASLRVMLSYLSEQELMKICKIPDRFDQTILHKYAADRFELLDIMHTVLLDAPFNKLVNSLSDLELMLPILEKAKKDLVPLAKLFLSESISDQNTHYAASNPEAFLRAYFTLTDLIKTEDNAAAQWLRAILTGHQEYDQESHKHHRVALLSEPLKTIFQTNKPQQNTVKRLFSETEHSGQRRSVRIQQKRQKDDSAVTPGGSPSS